MMVRRKIGPLVSDGVRIYFNEWLADGRFIVAETSIKGRRGRSPVRCR